MPRIYKLPPSINPFLDCFEVWETGTEREREREREAEREKERERERETETERERERDARKPKVSVLCLWTLLEHVSLPMRRPYDSSLCPRARSRLNQVQVELNRRKEARISCP